MLIRFQAIFFELTCANGKTSAMANSVSSTATFVKEGSTQSVNITSSNVFVGQGQLTVDSTTTPADSSQKDEVDVESTGYSVMFEDVFVHNQGPLRRGTRVFKGYQRHANGKKIPIAIKMIAPFHKKNLREVDHLVNLARHENVVEIIRSKVCTGRACPELFIVMELCKSDTFKDYCEETPFDFNQIMSYCKQLLKGIKHIHDNKIIHGDLKPENILLSLDGKLIKVSDFGISKQLRDGETHTRLTSQGTDNFRAPETFNSDVISMGADIFSLGLVLFGAFTKGKHPFGKNTHAQVYNMVENKDRDLSGLPCEIGEFKLSQFCDLLSRMLEFDPKKRPTVDQVLDDAFFASNDDVLNDPLWHCQKPLSLPSKVSSGDGDMDKSDTTWFDNTFPWLYDGNMAMCRMLRGRDHPRNLSVSIKKGEMRIDWNETDVQQRGYVVKICENDVRYMVYKLRTRVFHTRIKPSSMYRVSVAGIYDTGRGAASEKILYTDPAAPTNVQARTNPACPQTSLIVSFDDDDDDYYWKSYKVTVTQVTPPAVAATIASKEKYVIVNGLKPAHTYNIAVVAVTRFPGGEERMSPPAYHT